MCRAFNETRAYYTPGVEINRPRTRKFSVDFKELLRIVQRRWLTIVVFFLLGLLGGGALTYFQTPQYESSSRVFIAADAGTDNTGVSVLYSSIFAQQRAQSYAELATH